MSPFERRCKLMVAYAAALGAKTCLKNTAIGDNGEVVPDNGLTAAADFLRQALRAVDEICRDLVPKAES